MPLPDRLPVKILPEWGFVDDDAEAPFDTMDASFNLQPNRGKGRATHIGKLRDNER